MVGQRCCNDPCFHSTHKGGLILEGFLRGADYYVISHIFFKRHRSKKCLLRFSHFLKASPSLDAQHIVTLINFQEVTVFAFSVVNPLLYIGSSVELRKDVDLCKRHFFRNIETQQNQGFIKWRLLRLILYFWPK
jgi:hypothetical protein